MPVRPRPQADVLSSQAVVLKRQGNPVPQVTVDVLSLSVAYAVGQTFLNDPEEDAGLGFIEAPALFGKTEGDAAQKKRSLPSKNSTPSIIMSPLKGYTPPQGFDKP